MYSDIGLDGGVSVSFTNSFCLQKGTTLRKGDSCSVCFWWLLTSDPISNKMIGVHPPKTTLPETNVAPKNGGFQ